jgi:uncharacterized RDD family membrane protein YckC
MNEYPMLANPNHRYLATIIDGAIIFMLNIPIFILGMTIDVGNSLFIVLLLFFYRVIVYLIFDLIVPICTKGQTIGRVIIKLRLIKDDFTLANWKNFSMRSLIFIVIAFVTVVLKMQTFVHDYLAKTVVVYDKEFQKSA